MALDLDKHLGILPDALEVRGRRTELLARNLANADTPGYKARDLDFRDALAAASTSRAGGGRLALATTRPGHLDAGTATGPVDAELKYRVPLAPALDGNTVDAQLEQAAFAENAVRFQATLTFLNARFRSLMTAITGQ
jgi:flagellar basal-body rod protein FlgB